MALKMLKEYNPLLQYFIGDKQSKVLQEQYKYI